MGTRSLDLKGIPESVAPQESVGLFRLSALTEPG
jgi:hypothetical protein